MARGLISTSLAWNEALAGAERERQQPNEAVRLSQRSLAQRDGSHPVMSSPGRRPHLQRGLIFLP